MLPFSLALLLLTQSPPDQPPADIAAFFQPPAAYASDLGNYRTPLKFDDGREVKTPEQWKERRKEILAYWHRTLGEWPAVLKQPRWKVLSTEQRETFRQQQIQMEVAPDRHTDDTYLLTPAGKGPFPAVVVVYYESKTGIGQGKSELRDFAYQLAKRGFVTLSLGSAPASFYPGKDNAQLQPLSYHAYVAANCHQMLSQLPTVDSKRIGIVGHSYGGKWAMFASCLYEPFACAAWSDGGIVFDEARPNVNYWEPWYLGHEPGQPDRKRGVITANSPRTGPYKKLMAEGRDLHELHALMAPRPFLVSGGSEDQPERWKALNHAIAVNTLLGQKNRVAMTNRKTHGPTPESNEHLYRFFEWALSSKP